jgi:hypothetical protein
MHREILKSLNHLPHHRRVLEALIQTFTVCPGVEGLFVSGSTARRAMDQHSDVDLGVVFEFGDSRDAAWQDRWNWGVEPWFHRFDADHIKPHFVIYLFEPCVKADINLYTLTEMPGPQGAPYALLSPQSDILQDWCIATNVDAAENRDRDPAILAESFIHDDERVWAWLVYVSQHTLRGEFYSAAAGFPEIRAIIEDWSAILKNERSFVVRRIEDRYPSQE